MPHPEVLVEMDPVADVRWYTVRGKHYAFSGATRCLIKEEAQPDDPIWRGHDSNAAAYLQAKPCLVPAYPQTPTPTEDRPGLRTESVDWEAHRAFLRSL